LNTNTFDRASDFGGPLFDKPDPLGFIECAPFDRIRDRASDRIASSRL
jgi:hypothetical protein